MSETVRGRGRPRKHDSARARTAAWRETHQFRKVTVDVPANRIGELRRFARSLRSAAGQEDHTSAERLKWKTVSPMIQAVDIGTIRVTIETNSLQLRPFVWTVSHGNEMIAKGKAYTISIAKELAEKITDIHLAEIKYFFESEWRKQVFGSTSVMYDHNTELEGEDGRDEMSELEDKINKTKFSKEARDKAMAELKKLKSMSPMSAEATVVRNYLDWLLSVPWHNRTKIKRDIKGAEKVLNADHFGLEKVKERILEYLAVQQRMKKTEVAVAKSSGNDSKNTLYCSFCGKRQHEVRKLVAGPTVFICDECVELCMDIMR